MPREYYEELRFSGQRTIWTPDVKLRITSQLNFGMLKTNMYLFTARKASDRVAVFRKAYWTNYIHLQYSGKRSRELVETLEMWKYITIHHV